MAKWVNGGWSAFSRIVWWYDVGPEYSGKRDVTVYTYIEMDSTHSVYGNWPVSWNGWWGSGSGTYPINLGPGQRQELFGHSVHTVTLSDSQINMTFTVGATHVHGWVGSTLSIPVPARKPLTPSGLSVTRLSDGSHRLNWTRNGTYTAVVVQRRVNGGSWSQVGRPTGNASTYTDNTTSANNKYEYRVAGVSAGGQSGWSGTATVYTTPAAVAGVSAVKVGMDIHVTATGLPPYATAYELHDNGVLVDGNVTGWPFTHIAPDPSVTHKYTVYAKRGSLKSAGRDSAVVQLLAPPLAPSNLTPNGAVVASDGPVRFGWTHNPVDTTAQEAYRLRYRPAGGTWTTVTGTTASTRDITLTVGTVEWQIQTKGEHADYGPYSAVATVTVISRPGVAVQGAGSWDAPVYRVEWSWLQGEGRPQSAWQVELLEAGERVEFREGSGATTAVTLSTRLQDSGEYVVRVRAATGSVWSAWSPLDLVVKFLPPLDVEFGATWDDTAGVMNLALSQPANPVHDPVTNYAPSIVGDGTWAAARRNYAPNPSFEHGSAGVATETGVSSAVRSTNSWGVASGSACLNVVGASSGITLINTAVWFRSSIADRTVVDPERPVPAVAFSARRAAGVPLAVQVVAYWYSSAGTYLGATSSTDIHPISATQNDMDSNRYYHTMGSFAGAERVQVGVRFRDGDGASVAPPGFSAHLDAIHIDFGATADEALSRVQTYFDGDSHDFSIDPGMRTIWEGVAGDSASVMQIERVRGLTGVQVIAGVSSREGVPEARLIPTALNASFARFSIDPAARDKGTFIATQYKEAGIKPPLAAYANALRAQLPSQDSAKAPNTAGEFPLRVPFAGLTSLYYAILSHGGARGSGDVYWSKIGLFEGDYAGPWFDGDSGTVLIDGTRMVTQWDGRPHESTSTAVMPPATSTVDVERSTNGVDWVLIAEGIDPDSSLTDRESLSNGVTYYRVTTYTAAGAASTVIHEVVAGSTAVWLSAGEYFEHAARLPYDPSVQVGVARERVLKRYSGRSRPVVYSGEALTRTLQFGGTLLTGDSDVAGIDTLESIAQDPHPIHLYRDPDGRILYGMLDPLSITRVAHGIWAYSTAIEESEEP